MKHNLIEKQLNTLDKDEKELLISVENDEWIPNYDTIEQFASRKEKLIKAARDTLNSIPDTNNNLNEIEITIQIPQNILQKIEILAQKSGINYKNWIRDTLHKVVNG
jgi:predicted DNA binding CopG/RHH family protein